MDLNKILFWARDKSTLRILLSEPSLLYKQYAETCQLNDWLKIYRVNKPIALWMLKWCRFKLWNSPNELMISTFEPKPDENFADSLEYFFAVNPYIQSIAIDDFLYKQEYKHVLEKLKYLNKLKIILRTNLEWTNFHFPCLEEIEIEGRYWTYNRMMTETQEILKFTNLKSISLIRCDLSPKLCRILSQLKLNEIRITRIQRVEESCSMDRIFLYKKNVELILCGQNILCQLLTTRNNSIEKLSITTNGCYPLPQGLLDQVLYWRHLKRVKIKMEISSVTLYRSLKEILRTLVRTPTCTWYIDVTLRNFGELCDPPYRALDYRTHNDFANHVYNLLCNFQICNHNLDFDFKETPEEEPF